MKLFLVLTACAPLDASPFSCGSKRPYPPPPPPQNSEKEQSARESKETCAALASNPLDLSPLYAEQPPLRFGGAVIALSPPSPQRKASVEKKVQELDLQETKIFSCEPALYLWVPGASRDPKRNEDLRSIFLELGFQEVRIAHKVPDKK